MIYKQLRTVNKARIIVAVLCAGVGIGLSVFVVQGMWGITAKRQITAANSDAKWVYEAYKSTINELDKLGKLPEHSEKLITGQPDEEHEKDSFGYFMDNHFDRHMYYVIVTDGDWNVQYTLWSKDPIKPDAIHPYTFASQRDYMEPLFRDHSELVGCYEPPAPTEETT